jgi:hypothetical protein
MRVLVVEDERKIAEALKLGLEAESYQWSPQPAVKRDFFA